MYKTDRCYQSALAEFAVFFQNVTFSNDNGKVDKIALFDAIYKNHRCINEHLPFNVKNDVTCQLLDKNHHPNITTTKREYVDFNENEVLKATTTEVLRKRAIAIIREKVRVEYISPMDAIGLVAFAMEQAYNNHKEIDQEIEALVR